MKTEREMSRRKLEDQMWDGLLEAVLGSAGATVAIIVAIVVCVAPLGDGRFWVWPPALLLAFMGYQWGGNWRRAINEIERRKEEKRERKKREKRAARPYSTQPAMTVDPSSWTGRQA